MYKIFSSLMCMLTVFILSGLILHLLLSFLGHIPLYLSEADCVIWDLRTALNPALEGCYSILIPSQHTMTPKEENMVSQTVQR